jgi:nitroreductase
MLHSASMTSDYDKRFQQTGAELAMSLPLREEHKKPPQQGRKPLDVLEAIYLRRASRQYTQKKVEPELINLLLNAAVRAPSAMNKQPWAFVVIQDSKFLAYLNQHAKNFLRQSRTWRLASEHSQGLSDPSFDVFYGASTLIVFYAEKHSFEPIGDCYLAGENLMLAATGLGLGTCPIGFARDALRSESIHTELGLGDSYVPVLPIVVGYTTEYMPPTPRSPPRILSWMN